MGEKKYLNGTVLKLIAVVSMLIDHSAVVLVRPYANNIGLTELSIQTLSKLPAEYKTLGYTYFIMRVVGRLAFPIFAFLVVEGVQRTSNIMKYAGRLLLFALLSEVPFDLASRGEVLEFTHQNTLFTLFFGVLGLWGFETIARQIGDGKQKVSLLATVLALVTALAGTVLAELFYTDYGGIGVMVILGMYLARSSRGVQIFVGCLGMVFANPFALFGFIPIYFYNQERGKGWKYFFYIFYPAHLLVLYGISLLLYAD